MILRKLEIENFGPFKEYKISFPKEEDVIVLLTGRNNEGKTSLINALKYVHYATKVIGKSKQRRIINEDLYFEIYKQDINNIRIGRLINNYKDTVATVRAVFENDFEIIVYFDSERELIYSDSVGRIPTNINNLFGFIPPLGPISEREELIGKPNYLLANIGSSLAPRHLRNYFRQLLSSEDFELVKEIIHSSWSNIYLLNHEIDYNDNNRLQCFYKEDGIEREISWAGQGLQVWFQIITHLVRLRDSSILILDEPEINLYPEKQNELISIINQYFNKSVIIATHSMELINNANISHIINVQKNRKRPFIKSASDKIYLEKMRSQIGSHFNFIASQFEKNNNLIFTEDVSDYKIIVELLGDTFARNSFNIPLHGFQQYYKAIYFKEAYELLIGKSTNYLVILDRDYYPDEYLEGIKTKLENNGVSVIYTEGKEIENYFIDPMIYKSICTKEMFDDFENWFWDWAKSNKHDFISDYTGTAIKYSTQKHSPNTLLKKYNPIFEKKWLQKEGKIKLVPGKKILKKIRTYFKEKHDISLSDITLLKLIAKSKQSNVQRFIKSIKEKTI